MEDYQALCRQLEAVECSIPTVGLVEETEERLVERISLYQASGFTHRPNKQRQSCGIKMSSDFLNIELINSLFVLRRSV